MHNFFFKDTSSISTFAFPIQMGNKIESWELEYEHWAGIYLKLGLQFFFCGFFYRLKPFNLINMQTFIWVWTSDIVITSLINYSGSHFISGRTTTLCDFIIVHLPEPTKKRHPMMIACKIKRNVIGLLNLSPAILLVK